MRDSKNSSIGKKIRMLRGNATLDDFAKRVKISRRSLIYYEKDDKKHKPRSEVLLKIAEAFGKDLNFFFDYQVNRIKLVGMAAAGNIGLEDIDSYEEIILPWITNKDCIALKVFGNSMSPKIEPNDILIIEPIELFQFKPNKVYVVTTDQNTYVKKIEKKDDSFKCTSYNSDEVFELKYVRRIYKIIFHMHKFRIQD